MYDGYLAIGDPIAAQVDPTAYIPLVDNSRTAAFARAAGFNVHCAGCEVKSWTNLDPTTLPWYDPAVPESTQFLGYMGLQIGGTSKQPGIRNPLRAGNSGAVLGKLVQTYREIVVHVYMIATSQRGLSYGMSFLSGVLRGACLSSYDSCSQTMPMTLYTDCDTTNNTLRRQLFNVALFQGPEQTSKFTGGGGPGCNGTKFWGGDVVFTLAAGKPWLYRDPVALGVNLPFVKPVYWPCQGWVADPGTTGTPAPNCTAAPTDACVTWTPYSAAACTTTCAGDLSGQCMNDPNCPVPTDAPLPPDAGDPCSCLMTLNPITSVTRAEAGQLPKWSEVVPYAMVTADATLPMRRLLLRFYKSRPGDVCNFNTLNPCDLQGEIGIPYLPPGGSLILDGRAQTALVTCPDGSTTRPLLYSTAGPAPIWPVMSCGSAWCVAVTVDVNSVPTPPTATTAAISVSLVARESAA